MRSAGESAAPCRHGLAVWLSRVPCRVAGGASSTWAGVSMARWWIFPVCRAQRHRLAPPCPLGLLPREVRRIHCDESVSMAFELLIGVLIGTLLQEGQDVPADSLLRVQFFLVAFCGKVLEDLFQFLCLIHEYGTEIVFSITANRGLYLIGLDNTSPTFALRHPELCSGASGEDDRHAGVRRRRHRHHAVQRSRHLPSPADDDLERYGDSGAASNDDVEVAGRQRHLPFYLIYRPLPVVVAAAREASLNTMLSYELASHANINNLRKFYDLIKLLCRNKNSRKWRLESALVLVPSFMQFKFIA